MKEVRIPSGQDIVTYGQESDDGMYIILEGSADVYSSSNALINTLSVGDFIGELGLINDDIRAATVRARGEVVCANISKKLFDEIAFENRKVYGTFMNMLYTKQQSLFPNGSVSNQSLRLPRRYRPDAWRMIFHALTG